MSDKAWIELAIEQDAELGRSWWIVLDRRQSHTRSRGRIAIFHRTDTMYFSDGTRVNGIDLRVFTQGQGLLRYERVGTDQSTLELDFRIPRGSSFWMVAALTKKSRTYHV